MDSMSHDPAAGDIGSQLVEIAARGLDAGVAAAMSVTGLMPAGGEEVSAQAAMAFAAEAAAMLASNTAAQEELMRTGMTLTDISRMYSQVDGEAAGALTVGTASMSNHSLSGGSGASISAALTPAETLPSAAGAVARTPTMAGAIEASSSPMAQAAANAGSSVGSGTAPLTSMGQGGAAGGSSKAGLASAPAPAQDEDEDQRSGDDDPQVGEHLL